MTASSRRQRRLATSRAAALGRLDENILAPRNERMPDSQEAHPDAIVRYGAGPHPMGAVARAQGKSSRQMGPMGAFIGIDTIYPGYRRAAFVMPVFDVSIRRNCRQASGPARTRGLPTPRPGVGGASPRQAGVDACRACCCREVGCHAVSDSRRRRIDGNRVQEWICASFLPICAIIVI